jgi:NADH-quinone oxidoreductase subunit L
VVFAMDLIWLIPLLPGAGAALNGLAGIRFFSKRASGLVACTTMGLALLLSLRAFWQLLGLPADARSVDVVLGAWIPRIPLETAAGIGGFEVEWGFRLDPLSSLMILVVTGVGFLIHVYSIAYMHDEARGSYARYFAYLNLFCFFMLTLVLGSNFLVMFVGWEGVGLCSYLLIGYWYEKKSAADAGKKAFLVNRIGDWGFLIGIFLVFYTFGTLDFRAVADMAAAMPVETAGFGVLSLICLLLFIGATGKSAQIPLHVWLPDAMEGPTPVSALIHAATMVTAGVYMVGRNAVLFSHAPGVMEIVMVVGLLTALFAATIGLVQNDIKRVLAYSTVSQLGFMFLAMGVGAFAAGAFHLMTHAFFKALLFLCSGSVIHAMAGEQDMRRMGGLRRFLPVTYATMFIGTLAIAGIPPFSGFFSKDEILFRVFLENRLVWALAVAAAFMTAFYMFRLVAMTFAGPYRGPGWETAGGESVREAAISGMDHPADPGAHGRGARPAHELTHGPADSHATDAAAVHVAHGAWHGPHEAPRTMTGPLMALAAGALVAGLVGVPAALGGGNRIEHFLEPSFTPSHAAVSAHAVSSSGADAADRAAPNGTMSAPADPHADAAHMSHAGEIGLMALSVLVAAAGIWLARRIYVQKPEISERLAARWPGPHRLLLNKYYVDEIYDATVVRGTMESAGSLWTFDRRVVDGTVNGTGVTTQVSAWVSHLLDKYLVDGIVNLVGNMIHEGSYLFRRLQTGLIQNYALVMLFGVFAFVSLYLLSR